MPAHRHGKKKLLVIVIGVVSLGLVVAVVRNTLLTDSSQAVPVEESVDLFRHETTEPRPVPPEFGSVSTETRGQGTPDMPRVSLPEPGVYRYLTTGSESIDAMGGVTREYPAETTITVSKRGCGVHLTWNPLEQRHDEWGLCAPNLAVELQPEGAQFHEFFSQSQLDEISCDGTIAVTMPMTRSTTLTSATTEPSSEPATTWTCTLADDTWAPVWDLLGRSTLQVDGHDVTVTHARMTVDDADEYWEHTTADWYLADSGLPVSVHVTTSSRSPSLVGAVVYRETYDLQLESMSPLT